MKVGTERLRAYEPGYVSRLERYEQRLLDPTWKEARHEAAHEAARNAGYSSTATTVCGGPAANPEAELAELAELVAMFERLRALERQNARPVEAWSAELDKAMQGSSDMSTREGRTGMIPLPPRKREAGPEVSALKGKISTTEKFGQLELGRRCNDLLFDGFETGQQSSPSTHIYRPCTRGKDDAIRSSIA